MHRTQLTAQKAYDRITAEVAKYRNTLSSYLESLQKKNKNPAEGNLRVLKHKLGYQYYVVTEKGDTKGTYLRRKDLLGNDVVLVA